MTSMEGYQKTLALIFGGQITEYPAKYIYDTMNDNTPIATSGRFE